MGAQGDEGRLAACFENGERGSANCFELDPGHPGVDGTAARSGSGSDRAKPAHEPDQEEDESQGKDDHVRQAMEGQNSIRP